jgi:HK97 gp10 family phage protein
MADFSFELNRAETQRLLVSQSGPVGKYLARTAQNVVNVARARCPVDTGNLRGSITYEIRREAGSLTARVGTNVPYAIYVHEGTRYKAGRPFLAEALRSVNL